MEGGREGGREGGEGGREGGKLHTPYLSGHHVITDFDGGIYRHQNQSCSTSRSVLMN